MSAKKRQNSSEASSKLVSMAIIGSLHVTQLHGFCASSTKANSDWHMDLGDKAVIHWFGRRGGTIENILDQDLTAIQSCAPKICVLVVDGNDLDQGLDPMRVACRQIGLAQVLRNRAGHNKFIYWASSHDQAQDTWHQWNSRKVLTLAILI